MLMDQLILESGNLIKETEEGSKHGLMDQNMKDNTHSTKEKDMENIILVNHNSAIKENGKIIKCMEKECLLRIMVKYLREVTKITNSKVLEFKNGMMIEFIKDNSKMT